MLKKLIGILLRATPPIALCSLLLYVIYISFFLQTGMPETPEMEAFRKTKMAGIEINQKFKLGMVAYRLDIGNYPSTEQGLRALMYAPQGTEKKWKGPYLDELPQDPWSQPYQYRYPGENNSLGARRYDLWSLGPDGIESEDDITNWNR